MSITAEFIKNRVFAPTAGRWSSKFSAVKNFALDNGIPLVAVWSNGDNCDYCKKLETSFMRETFKNWMSGTNYLFYFGCNLDTSKDDGHQGVGYYWCWKNKSLSEYPFVRIYWPAEKIDEAMTGNTLLNNEQNEEGARTAISRLKQLLDEYRPKQPIVELTPEPEPEQKPTLKLKTRAGSGWSAKLSTMFGLNRDCTILTKDNKILKYQATTKNITLIGDYDPLKNLQIAV